jgi:hypothetical protein
MEAINNVKRPLAGNFKRNAAPRFFKQRSSPKHGAELLWPLIPGDLSRQRF